MGPLGGQTDLALGPFGKIEASGAGTDTGVKSLSGGPERGATSRIALEQMKCQPLGSARPYTRKFTELGDEALN